MSHRQCNCRSLLPDSVTLITRTCGSHYPPPLPSLHSTPLHTTSLHPRHLRSSHTTVSFITTHLHLFSSRQFWSIHLTVLSLSSHLCFGHHITATSITFLVCFRSVRSNATFITQLSLSSLLLTTQVVRLFAVRKDYISLCFAWRFLYSIFSTKL